MAERVAAVLVSALLVVIAPVKPAVAQPYRVHLRGGTFYGPGMLNDALLPNGELSNLIMTGPLTGYIPFFNNGPEPPNVLAEIEQGGIVDGKLSDGVTLINENLDAGLIHLGYGQLHFLLAGVAGGPNDGVEKFAPDDRGNLTLTVDVGLDPGDPEEIIRVDGFRLTTGVATVPLSLQTMAGRKDGDDRAGSLPSGTVIIGRLGDFDQDGFLDGVLVSANHVPSGGFPGGAPMASIRPFFTDIPIAPETAGFLTVNGIIQNFPEVVRPALAAGDVVTARRHLEDVVERLEVVQRNLARALAAGPPSGRGPLVQLARDLVTDARTAFGGALARLASAGIDDTDIRAVTTGFRLVGGAHSLLMSVQQNQP